MCLFSFRLQSRYEPGVRVWEAGLDDEQGGEEENVTALLANIMDTARPLVGIRSKSNIKWYEGSYPLLVVYTEIDLSSKSEGWCVLYCLSLEDGIVGIFQIEGSSFHSFHGYTKSTHEISTFYMYMYMWHAYVCTSMVMVNIFNVAEHLSAQSKPLEDFLLYRRSDCRRFVEIVKCRL